MPCLRSDSVQDGNEEKMARANSGPWLQKSAMRQNAKTRSLFLCVLVRVWTRKSGCMVCGFTRLSGTLQTHLQTTSPHVFLSVTAHGSTFLPRVILHRIVPSIFVNDLLEAQARSARGSPGPQPTREHLRTPTSIVTCMQAQSNRTSAILFDSGQ